MKPHRLALIVVILLLALITLLWLLSKSSEDIKVAVQVADGFSKFGLGFGAIATGLGGLSLAEDWLRKQESLDDNRKELIKRWLKQYSPKEHKVTWRLIQGDRSLGGDLCSGFTQWI